MELKLRKTERSSSLSNAAEMRAIDAVASAATGPRSSQAGLLNYRRRVIAPVLALAFAALASSCDGPTMDGAIVHSAAKLLKKKLGDDEKTPTCIAILSSDPNKQHGQDTRVLVTLPSTNVNFYPFKRQREREAERAGPDLARCYEKFGLPVPPELAVNDTPASDIGVGIPGISAANAQPSGPCLSDAGGTCDLAEITCGCR